MTIPTHQLGLGLSLRATRPLSRHDGPMSSDLAAAEIIASGHLARSLRRTLEAVVAHDGSTSAELAAGDVHRRYEIARRLSELERQGFVAKAAVRTCRATQRKAHAWYATPAARDALAGKVVR